MLLAGQLSQPVSSAISDREISIVKRLVTDTRGYGNKTLPYFSTPERYLRLRKSKVDFTEDIRTLCKDAREWKTLLNDPEVQSLIDFILEGFFKIASACENNSFDAKYRTSPDDRNCIDLDDLIRYVTFSALLVHQVESLQAAIRETIEAKFLVVANAIDVNRILSNCRANLLIAKKNIREAIGNLSEYQALQASVIPVLTELRDLVQ
jgi:hypothetical protein